MKEVLIVGGGSAGWITAAYLDSAINGRGAKRVGITLVESATIGRIGVGEATIPTIQQTLNQIGIGEQDFMRATSATFKHGIIFDDWAHAGHSYINPFDRYRNGGYFDQSGVRWMFSDGKMPYASTVSMQPRLAREGRAPKRLDDDDYHGVLGYAYHMDAELLADYLMEVATGRGVRRIVDDVTKVGMLASGNIAHVTTASGQELKADLFVDCTGFASILSSKTLGVGFEDYSPWLLCDRAVTMRLPHELTPDRRLKSYTTSTALSAGWAWDIGLQERRGVGYVYSSQFISDEEAEAELRAFEGPHCAQTPARRLKFRVGHSSAPWTGNCVAIGLSSGFIEPLESTGLYLIEFAARLLSEHFPFVGDMQPLAQRFNSIVADQFEELLQFIALHYCLTQRSDTPFWREVQKPERIPPRLQERFRMWDLKPPSMTDCLNTQQLFDHASYEYILFGMGWRPDIIRQRPQGAAKPIGQPGFVTNAEEKGLAELPSHEDWLRHCLARQKV